MCKRETIGRPSMKVMTKAGRFRADSPRAREESETMRDEGELRGRAVEQRV